LLRLGDFHNATNNFLESLFTSGDFFQRTSLGAVHGGVARTLASPQRGEAILFGTNFARGRGRSGHARDF
jgi:hypothetical protein